MGGVMDFNLRSVSRVCAGTGEPLIGGTECWSVLVEVGGKLVRQDYSTEFWEGPPDGAIGYWKAHVPAESEADRRKIDPDSLFDYFAELCESPNPAEQEFQYVLALLLLRKKRLILEESIEVDDMPAMRLVGSGGEGPFDVIERELTDEQIADFQQQLCVGRPDAA